MEQVRRWIHEAQRITVLTGAGMSAESGVPTFRDAQTGLWANFRPEELATEAAFRAHPQRVWDWYQWRRQEVAKVSPNAGHLALARFSRRHPGRLTLVTQNVDGLHQRAGQQDAIDLHGNLMEDRWLDPVQDCCRDGVIEDGHPPRCPGCGNLRRPAVVWFGEMLPPGALAAAEAAARSRELMLVVGTAGVVYPAAGLAYRARESGATVVVINPQTTDLDAVAQRCLRERAAQCLPKVMEDFNG